VRFDVKVVWTATHVIAVDAEDAIQAQDRAMQQMSDRKPEKIEMHTEVERGAR
jgi:hypothetical protein